eukprot:s1769_g8.t1
MSDATDDVKSFGAFKKSSEPGSVVSFWEDIKDGFVLAKDIGDVDKMSADDRNTLLRTNKDVILSTLLAFSHLQRVLTLAELAWCIECKYKDAFNGRLAHSQAGEASNPAAAVGAGSAPDCTRGGESDQDGQEDEEQEEEGEQEEQNQQPDEDHDKGQEQDTPEAAGHQEQQEKGAAEDWVFIPDQSFKNSNTPRSLIVVLLLMNYMGLADKHNDKIDVLEIFAGTAAIYSEARRRDFAVRKVDVLYSASNDISKPWGFL